MLPTRSFAGPLEVLQKEFDRAFSRASNWAEDNMPMFGYPVDIRETADSLIVEAELPGFARNEIDLTLENSVLTISAVHKQEKTGNAEQGEYHLNERRFRRLQRSFRLPSTVDEGAVDAKLKDGILTLKLNKRDEVKPRKIEVK